MGESFSRPRRTADGVGLRARTAFALILILSLGSLLPLPTALGHPQHLQVQNEVVDLFEEVSWDQWVAQSFLAESDYNITRVSLLVTDIGPSDVLEVGIRADAGGFPDFFNLTGGSVDGPSAGNWVNVDLDPWVELTAGETYWIVAHSGQTMGMGYVWWGSANESAYLFGEGMVSLGGFGWFPLGHDMTFRVWGFHQPSITFSVTPSVTTLAPGETVDYRIEFRNTGLGSSAALWVNVTLPSELRYVTDDAAAIGGSRSGSYSFEFQDIGPGTYVFNVTARAEGGFPDGTQALTKFTFDVLDHNSAPLTTSSQDVTVTIVNASLTYAAGVTPISLAPGDAVVFRLNFTNSGGGTASGVWVNVTLPGELSYDSDDAGAIGGTRSGSFSFEFLDVAPGSYIFNVTALADGGLPNGTVATTNVTFQAVDLGGASLNRTALDLDVTIRNAVLSLTVVPSAVTAQPGDTLLLNATVRNLGAEAALNLRITASVDANATYLTSAPAGTYDAVLREVEWNFGTLAAGGVESVEWTLEVPVGTPDGALVRSLVCARAEDLAASDLPRQEEPSVTSVQAPDFAPSLLLDRAWAERGDEVVASFHYNNTGSVAAPRAWVNVTLGGHYELVTLSPALPFTPTADGFSVELASVAVGLHLLEIRLLVVRGLEDGVAMEVGMRWTATDGNGNPLPPEVLNSSVDLRAPAVVLSLESSKVEVVSGFPFLLNLTIENVGRADALGWLNLTLPAGTTFQGDEGPLNGTVQGDRVTWTLDALSGGTNLTLQIELQAGENLGPNPFRFDLDLTDGRGSDPSSRSSNVVSVAFVAPPSPLTNFPWLLLLLPLVGLAAAGAWAIRRRGGTGEVGVEEVFVVDRGGSLLAHRSSSILQYKDEDLVVAMLTAIQSYIEDVFSYGRGDTIRGLEFGERRILIEDGASHFVAIVYRGDDDGRLRERARTLCATIDDRFGKIIEDWNGDTDKVRGIAALLPHIWRKRGHQRV
ncbi:MAG: choice-of-anchor R domain-containing protein [Thermoplasmata archaeon]